MYCNLVYCNLVYCSLVYCSSVLQPRSANPGVPTVAFSRVRVRVVYCNLVYYRLVYCSSVQGFNGVLCNDGAPTYCSSVSTSVRGKVRIVYEIAEFGV